METCSQCGCENVDEAIECVRCGNRLSEPLPRIPRPDARSVLLRTFANEPEAQLAAQRLRAAGVSVLIGTDDCGGVLPSLTPVSEYRLLVTAHHREAAEAVLAEFEESAPLPPELSRPAPPRASGLSVSTKFLIVFLLGIVVGVAIHIAFQLGRDTFSGTIAQDFDNDGRTDAWDTYVKGAYVKFAVDRNGDEQPDQWSHYKGQRTVAAESDDNFDGKADVWYEYDTRSTVTTGRVDVDFDGTADATIAYEADVPKERVWKVPQSGLVWKKDRYSNGAVVEMIIDHDRDGRFDEQITFDVYGIPVARQKLE